MSMDFDPGSKNGHMSYEQVQALQIRAGIAVIEANVDPSAYSETQHEQVRALRAEAAEAVMIANCETPSLRSTQAES